MFEAAAEEDAVAALIEGSSGGDSLGCRSAGGEGAAQGVSIHVQASASSPDRGNGADDPRGGTPSKSLGPGASGPVRS